MTPTTTTTPLQVKTSLKGGKTKTVAPALKNELNWTEKYIFVAMAWFRYFLNKVEIKLETKNISISKQNVKCASTVNPQISAPLK